LDVRMGSTACFRFTEVRPAPRRGKRDALDDMRRRIAVWGQYAAIVPSMFPPAAAALGPLGPGQAASSSDGVRAFDVCAVEEAAAEASTATMSDPTA
jgi:hypothetical protein